jgi:hypothetical protein
MLLAASGLAQTTQGTYQVWGSGCAGSATTRFCLSANDRGGTPWSISPNDSVFYLEVAVAQTTPLFGFEILTKTTGRQPLALTGHVHDADTTGRPNPTPIRSAPLVLAVDFAWHRCTLTTPLIVQANQKIFLSWTGSDQMWTPYLSGGATTTHWYRAANSTQFQGPFSTTPWAWRAVCPGTTGAAPIQSHADVPRTFRQFTVMLDAARPLTGAALITGTSMSSWGAFRLPLDLTPFGAPSCRLLVSPDLFAPAATDALGKASLPVRVPGDKQLVGLTFHNQWLVLDPTVNALQLVFSEGGSGRVGDG